MDIPFSNRTVCCLAVQVACIAAGSIHSQYSKILEQHLGMAAVNASTFYETIKYLHSVVTAMLISMCDDAKEEMKVKDPTEVGSWQRAITSSDGVWLTRKFSQNCTFTVRNYANNSLLYFVHLCMCGKASDICGEIYHGTAKGAEGHAAGIAFAKAKEEGMHIEVQWQNGDSSAAKAFRQHFPDEENSKVMLCGGHVARAHIKLLGEYAKHKSFSVALLDIHKKFPKVLSVM